MGICIEIKKINVKRQQHFYQVSSNDFKNAHFIVSINPLKQEILFYESKNEKEPVISYHLLNKKWHINQSTKINQKLLPYIILQINKAIKDKNFAQHIGYAA